MSHSWSDEWSLTDEPRVLWPVRLCVEREDPAPIERIPECTHENGGRGKVARNHNPRLRSGELAEPLDEPVKRESLHSLRSWYSSPEELRRVCLECHSAPGSIGERPGTWNSQSRSWDSRS